MGLSPLRSNLNMKVQSPCKRISRCWQLLHSNRYRHLLELDLVCGGTGSIPTSTGRGTDGAPGLALGLPVLRDPTTLGLSPSGLTTLTFARGLF